MFKFIPLIALFLTACSTASKEDLTKREQWKLLEQKPEATKVVVKDRDGDITEFIYVQESTSDVQLVSTRSEMAIACERYARKTPAQIQWLQSCDVAMTTQETGTYNRSATQFNKSLILTNLGEHTKARDTLRQVIEENPDFTEAEYELARLNYVDRKYAAALKYAQSAINNDLRNPSRAYYIIGKSYEADFKFQDARTTYELGLKQNEGAANLRRSLERLNRLWPA